MNHGIMAADLMLFAVYGFITILSISVGYHRLFSHRAFKAHPVLEALLLFFGAASVQQSALKWSAQHRMHHKYTDTDADPYNIKQGFWHAHMGWIYLWKTPFERNVVQDLNKFPLVAHQHQYFQAWVIIAGFLTPLFIGWLYGSILGAYLFGIALRITVVHHATFCINSFAHMFGSRHFDPYSTARDSWVGAILTNGEGYHNYHHRFPSDYRNGVKWYHWDPAKWLIKSLSYLGVTSALNTPSARDIQQAIKETAEIQHAA
ncbi:MAG: fatty acid desaturase [Candidatus Omnitrophica bacterium]|nr:fatty acid desaturase [Candidatus Omnitrophota bacterium]